MFTFVLSYHQLVLSHYREEEERSGDEDIRVVVSRFLKLGILHLIAYFFPFFGGNFLVTPVFLQERKHFVVKLKTKHRQPWCSQINQQQQQQSREKAGNAGQGTSPEVQHGTSHKTLAKASTPRVTPLSLDTEMFDDGESLCGFQAKRARSDESVTRDSNFLDRCKAPKRATRNRKTRGSERKDSTTAAEPQTGDTHTDGQPPIGQTDVEPDSRNILHRLPQLKSDTDNNSVCQESRANKRKTEENSHGSVENEMRQGQEEPEGLCVAKSVNVEVDETPSLSDSRAEPPAWQTGDELEFNERNCMESSSHGDATVTQAETDSPKSKHKKKKRKKCAAQNVSQEEDRKLESEVRMEESSVSKKKKKRKKRREEEAAQLQLSPAHVPLSDGAGAEFKEDETTAAAGESGEGDAWNTSTGQMEKSGNGLENTASSEVTLKSSKVKKKKHKKKQESSCVDANDTKGGEKVVDVTLCNDAASSEESTRKSVKKMKTKKLSDGADTSYPSEKNEQVEYSPAKPKQGLEDQNAAIVTKKKKKGKLFRRIPSEDGVAQSDESVSVQKKTKKRTSSFLAADVEEKDAQTEGEQNSLPQFTDAHVWGSENPSVSAGDFEMKSAEMAGTLEDSNNRVWKKNKKRKRKTSLMEDGVEEDHKQDFEEPKSTLPDSTNAGAKRKNEDAELKESTENTCSVVSHGRKGKNLTSPLVSKGNHTHSDDISGASHTFGRACKETVFEQASPSKALKVRSPKLSNTSVSNLSFSDYIMEKKKKKFKHKLHSFNLAFLSDV